VKIFSDGEIVRCRNGLTPSWDYSVPDVGLVELHSSK